MTIPPIQLDGDRDITINTHAKHVSMTLAASISNLQIWWSMTPDETRILGHRLIEAADMVAPVVVREAA